MVFGVGDVQRPAIRRKGHALRLGKGSGAVLAVLEPVPPAADHLAHLAAVYVGDDDAPVVGVGDKEPSASGIGQDAAREREHRLGQSLALQLDRYGGAVERSPRIGGPYELHDHRFKGLVSSLADVHLGQASQRIDQDQRRPGLDAPVVPHLAPGIVGDGVLDAIAQDHLAHVLGILFVRELGRVDADHDQLVGELVLQTPEVGEFVDAVDTPIGPKIDEYDLAAELRQGKRPVDVEPIQVRGQLWCFSGIQVDLCVLCAKRELTAEAHWGSAAGSSWGRSGSAARTQCQRCQQQNNRCRDPANPYLVFPSVFIHVHKIPHAFSWLCCGVLRESVRYSPTFTPALTCTARRCTCE
jgi:hypothetical protein